MRLVTISNNKNNGDRSFSHGIWQIVGESKMHTAVWPVRDDFWCDGHRQRVHYLNNTEYTFCSAYPLLSNSDLKSILLQCKVGLPAQGLDYTTVNIHLG